MSQTERDELADSSESDFATVETRSTSLRNRASNESGKSWPTISAFMSLLGKSRTNDDNTEITNENIDEELSCPICRDIMKEVFATSCGHSFCYECITTHIDSRSDCPLCRSNLTRAELFPNFQLNKLAEHRMKTLKEKVKSNEKDSIDRLIRESKGDHSTIAKALATSLSHEDLTTIFKAAIEERKKSEVDESKIKKELLHLFLAKLKKKNKKTVDDLLTQNVYLGFDLKSINDQEYEQQVESTSDNQQQQQRKRRYSQIADDEVGTEIKEEYFNEGQRRSISSSTSIFSETPYPLRMEARFDDLRDIYLSRLSNVSAIDKRRKLLHEFSSTLYQLTRYDGYKVLDTLNYTDIRESSSIVSSIEFDRDQGFFAVGGVTRDIKIYDYGMMGVPSASNMLHCPVRIMRCGHKISCLSWSPYIKSQLASSDYEGIIDIWDVGTGQKTASLDEHRKRTWSVDICHQNPNLLASGSDDATVKVWSLSSNSSIYTLGQKGNVCCAKFAPNNSNYLAVGSADHNVSCFDLRYPALPFKEYDGHKKAVSYVKWLNDNEIISASTDSTLKLWNRESAECIRTFSGHSNEKNFVGLSANGDWISCGSETNTLYTYHKSSTIPVSTFKFPFTQERGGLPDVDADSHDINDQGLFVSALCWKEGTSDIVAANSKGVVKVLQMRQ